MKILFSNPPWNEHDPDGRLRQGIRAGSRWPFTRHAIHNPGDFQFGGYLPFPFFLSHAAAHTKMLIPAEVVVRDSIARGETNLDFNLAAAHLTWDFIILETATPSLEHDLKIVAEVGKWGGRAERNKFILCGPIDAYHHQDILDHHPNVHAILQGEYDKLVTKALTGPRGVYSHDLLTREEMGASPFPMWDEECWDHYWDGCPEGQQSPQLQMWTSRGCPFKCCFCVWPATMTGNDPDGTQPRSVRFYPAEWVEGYIRERLAKHPYKCVYFDDDTFNLQDKHVLGICDVMKRIGLPWSAMCRADTIKATTWQSMKESGCFGVKIGMESGSQYVIDHIVGKKLNLKQAEETCRWLQSIGIKVHTTWTVGLPGETHEMRKETLDAIKRMYYLRAHTTHQLSGTSEIEGTPLATLRQKGHLEKYDGAVIDENYVVMADGQKKIEEMTK